MRRCGRRQEGKKEEKETMKHSVVLFIPYPKITLSEAVAMLSEEGSEGYMDGDLEAVVVRKEEIV